MKLADNNFYVGNISRLEAVKLAGYYLHQRICHGSKPTVIFEHAVHIFNVAKIAEKIAQHSSGKLDPDTAYILGLLHDIGRIKDETKTGIPHGIQGFQYLEKIGLKNIAPISLTHGFINKNLVPSDFPTYSHKQLTWAKNIVKHLHYNDYDRLIQLADLFSRGKEILSIKQRLEKNKAHYHIKNLSFENQAFALRDYFDQKFNINVEQLVSNMFHQPVFSPRKRFPPDNFILFQKHMAKSLSIK